MAGLINWISTKFEEFNKWWIQNGAEVNESVNNFFRRFNRALDRFARNFTRLVIFGIILNVISIFCPELSEKYPTIFAWYDGFIQVEEFVLKTTLMGIYSLFNGTWNECHANANEALMELWQQFVNWLSSLQY